MDVRKLTKEALSSQGGNSEKLMLLALIGTQHGFKFTLDPTQGMKGNPDEEQRELMRKSAKEAGGGVAGKELSEFTNVMQTPTKELQEQLESLDENPDTQNIGQGNWLARAWPIIQVLILRFLGVVEEPEEKREEEEPEPEIPERPQKGQRQRTRESAKQQRKRK